MVGYNPLEKAQLSHREYAFAGAISGSATRAICQPLDVIKIRFQLQVEPLKDLPASKYHGVIQAAMNILKEEGVLALWKGHVPGQVLSVVYGVVQYSSFEVITHHTWDYLPESLRITYKPLTHTVCGGLSGCIGSALIHPLDVIRTRFVAQGEPKVYKTLFGACRKILTTEGVRGFYKGLGPAIMSVGPQMGLQFGFYSLFTGVWHRSRSIWSGHPPKYFESIVCGSGSGFIAKLLIYPLDVVKKRLQVQGFEEARKHFGSLRHYSGTLNCLTDLFREEGLRGIYKGLRPSLIKAAAVAGVNFCIYEQVRSLLVLHHVKTGAR